MRRLSTWEVWRPVSVDDGAGGQTVTMVMLRTERGDMRELTGQERIEAQQAGAEHTHTGFFRARADIERNDELRRGSAAAALDLPGGSGNYASTPHSVSMDISGSMTLIADVALADWTPISEAVLIAKYTTTGNQRAYLLDVDTAGRVLVRVSPDGTVPPPFYGPDLSGLANLARQAIRAEVVPDNGADEQQVTFYLAPTSAGPWIQQGAPVVLPGAISIANTTASLTFGAFNEGDANVMVGRYYRAMLYDGIEGVGGVALARPDFTAQDPGATSFADDLGRIYTVNGAAAITAGDAANDVLRVESVTPGFPENAGRTRVSARSVEAGG